MKWHSAKIVRSLLAMFSAAAFFTAVAMLQVADAQDSAEVNAPELTLLDGLRFDAGIVRDGDKDAENHPLEDQLVFEDGLFSSAICTRYNFTAAPYWVRREGNRIHFLAELSSPTDGNMVWQGTVQNGELTGTMRWTRERWYWTINAEHTIRGGLIGSAAPASTPAN